MSEIAFVGGATGYTGREVVRALRARGIDTHAHVRPDSSALARYRSEFQGFGAHVDTTPWEEAAMIATMKRIKPTLVFALLGTTRARAKRATKEGRDAAKESYEAVDYGLTAMMLRACLAAELHPRFLYVSSLGVSEGSANPYLEVRARFERELKASGVPYTIARPSFITGPDREESRPAERYGAALADGLLSVIGVLGGHTLKARYASNDAATLAHSLVAHALRPESVNAELEGEALRLK
ncbi:MAG: NAD(P)H-binding protein [Sandaracinaceae bacterium]|nr:NAD(P)H-binding protein [Sandaracinaceae bacterium]